MSRIDQFKTYVKTEPMQLDVAMAEVYEALTAGRSGFAMVDGGAHKGWHTLRMLRVPGCAAVWAIEADPTIGDLLTSNMQKWHGAPQPWPRRAGSAMRRLAARAGLAGRPEQAPELHLVRAALQDRPEITEIPWMSSSSHVGRNSIRAENAETPSIWSEHPDVEYRGAATVPAVTIDAMLADEPRPLPFIKLDLEGADILALRGGAGTLETRRPLVAFENSSVAPKVHGYSIEDVAEFLRGLGYVPLDYVGNPLEPASWFSFYEAWAVPTELLPQVRAEIDRAITRRIGTA